jgi:hypothetical protein
MMQKPPCIPCEKRKERILNAIHAVRQTKRRILRQSPLPPRTPRESEGGAPEGAWRPKPRRIFTSNGENHG